MTLANFERSIEEKRKFGLDRKTFYEMFERGYAPLNFDADNKKFAKKIARKLLKEFKNCEIMFRKSASRRGYHFTIFKNGKQLFLPIKKVIVIRKRIGDCIGRLSCDILRSEHNLPIGILFDHKAKIGKKFKFATKWKKLEKVGDLNGRNRKS